ncbi:MAG: TIGR03545 family protein [Calditrichaeota bacterium]|nr:TIGR03545 family protein [Calditrichota bacterium]
MRKSGIIILLVIVGLFVAIGYLLTDSLFESLIEDTASDLNGAMVEIDDFDFSLAGPKMSWQRLQITDPANTMQNQIETGFTEFDLEFWPLLSGKFIIENFELSGIKTGTARENDGALPKTSKEITTKDSTIAKTQNKQKKQVEKEASFDISSASKNVNVDSIVSLLKLQSPAKLDSAKNVAEQNYAKWQEKIKSIDPGEDVAKIQDQIKAIDVKKVKDLDSFNKALSSVKEVRGSVDKLEKSYTDTKKDFDRDYSGASSVLGQLDDWVKDDYKNAMAMAKLPDFSTQNIAKMLFGQKIVNQVNEYLGYVGTARTYLNKFSSNDKEEDPPRLKGQDIYFPTKNARPDFWLQKLALSGNLSEEMPLSGSVTDISSDPKMIGKPVEMDISGSSTGREYGLKGQLNYLDSIPKENFTIDYNGFAINGMELSKSDLLPTAIKKGEGNIQASLNMNGDNFDGKIMFVSTKVEFAFATEKASGKLASIVRDVFNETKNVNVDVLLKGRKGDLVFAVKSNLDDKLGNAFKKAAGKEVEQAKAKIRKKIDKQVAAKKAEVEKIINDNKKKLESQLAKYQDKIDEQKKQLDKKKKDIEDEKDKLGKKVKDKLKGLFKP